MCTNCEKITCLDEGICEGLSKGREGDDGEDGAEEKSLHVHCCCLHTRMHCLAMRLAFLYSARCSPQKKIVHQPTNESGRGEEEYSPFVASSALNLRCCTFSCAPGNPYTFCGAPHKRRHCASDVVNLRMMGKNVLFAPVFDAIFGTNLERSESAF
jgi:hypothetical protein